MSEPHDHKVSYYEGWSEERSRMWEASDFADWHRWNDEGHRFSFCPDCGASLATFWKATDAAMEAQRQREIATDDLENRYSDVSPT